MSIQTPKTKSGSPPSGHIHPPAGLIANTGSRPDRGDDVYSSLVKQVMDLEEENLRLRTKIQLLQELFLID